MKTILLPVKTVFIRMTRSSTVSMLIKWDIRPKPSNAIGIKVKPTFILITLRKDKIK